VCFLRGNVDKESRIIRTSKDGLFIYTDMAVLFPIICTVTSRLIFPSVSGETNCRNLSSQRQLNPHKLMASVNGISLPNLSYFYSESPEFLLEIPKTSRLRKKFDPIARPGKCSAVAAGYWIMLKPFKKGRHRIKFEGIHRDGFKTSGDYSIMAVARRDINDL
jgi:hypothetical protein